MVKRKNNDYATDELQLEIFEANANKKLLLSKDPSTKERFKAFRDTKIDQQRLKNFIANKFEISLSDVGSTIISTATKIFIGEIVEEARRIKTHLGQSGPIQKKIYQRAVSKVMTDFSGQLFA